MRKSLLLVFFVLFLLGCGGGGGGGDSEGELHTYNISGTVKDITGEPIPNVKVSVFNVSVPKTAYTDQLGVFHLQGVGATDNEVWPVMKLEKSGYVTTFITYPATHEEEEDEDVDAGDLTLMTTEEYQAWSVWADLSKSMVFGMVEDENGDGAAGVEVQTTDGQVLYFSSVGGTYLPNPNATSTDSTGVFAIVNVSTSDAMLPFVLKIGGQTVSVRAWVENGAFSLFVFPMAD